jgi:hypothetical protein
VAAEALNLAFAPTTVAVMAAHSLVVLLLVVQNESVDDDPDLEERHVVAELESRLHLLVANL